MSVDDSARAQRSVFHRLFIPGNGSRGLIWVTPSSLYLLRLDFRVPHLGILDLDYAIFNELSTSTYPSCQQVVFSAQGWRGMRRNLTLALKFLDVPCLSLLAGITAAVSYMFVMGRSTADNLFSARVESGVNSLSAAPSVTVGRTKFDISGLIQNAKGDIGQREGSIRS